MNDRFIGGVGVGFRENDLATRDFFHKDWVYEAVGIHEGIRMRSAMHYAHAAQQHANLQNMQAMGGMQGMPLTPMR